MNLAIRAIFISLLLTCASSVAHARSGVISVEYDLDGDGRLEHILLDKARDPSLSILHGKRVLWRGVPSRWQPWKLSVADVDGDGRLEIVVGVYKPTRYFPKAHNCLFIYGWDGQRAYPKWLGSSLSRPFIDFAFVDSTDERRKELVAIETKRNGRRCIAAYSWNGFGFTLDWQRGDWLAAEIVEGARDRVILKADGVRVTFTIDEMRSKS